MTANSLPLPMIAREESAEAADARWATLYRAGAIAALATIVMTVIQIFVFIAWPPPSFLPTASAAGDWFALLQRNWVIGLMDLDVAMLIDYPLNLLALIALCVAVYRASESLTTIAAALGVAGIASYFACNPAFAMLSLASQHAAASSEAQRTSLVAAGQAILANFQGSGFNASYVLIAIAGLFLCAAMWQSGRFGRPAIWVGIVFYAMNLVPANAGVPGMILGLGSLIPMAFWLVLVARRLLQLAQGPSGRGETQS